MDAIASAIGYAWLLGQTNTEKYMAARVGQVNAQTAFALDYFKMDAPMLVTDVRTRVSDLVEKMPSLNRGQTMLEACQSIAPEKLKDNCRTAVAITVGPCYSF